MLIILIRQYVLTNHGRRPPGRVIHYLTKEKYYTYIEICMLIRQRRQS